MPEMLWRLILSFFSRFFSWLDQAFRSARKRSRPVRSRTEHTTRLELQSLETRLALSAYSVTNTSASAAVVGSLGYEIAAAVTANDPAAMITFSGVPSDSTIALASGSANAAAAEYGPTAYFINGASGTNITINGAGAPG